MIISDKQIMKLLNVARLFALKNDTPQDMRETLSDFIFEIEMQQSEELRDISDD